MYASWPSLHDLARFALFTTCRNLALDIFQSICLLRACLLLLKQTWERQLFIVEEKPLTTRRFNEFYRVEAWSSNTLLSVGNQSSMPTIRHPRFRFRFTKPPHFVLPNHPVRFTESPSLSFLPNLPFQVDIW